MNTSLKVLIIVQDEMEFLSHMSTTIFPGVLENRLFSKNRLFIHFSKFNKDTLLTSQILNQV